MQQPARQELRPDSSAGHLSVHLDAANSSDIPFLFQQQGKYGAATMVSAGSTRCSLLAIFLIDTDTDDGHTVPMQNPTGSSARAARPGRWWRWRQQNERTASGGLPGKDQIAVPIQQSLQAAQDREGRAEPDEFGAFSEEWRVQRLRPARSKRPGPPRRRDRAWRGAPAPWRHRAGHWIGSGSWHQWHGRWRVSARQRRDNSVLLREVRPQYLGRDNKNSGHRLVSVS